MDKHDREEIAAFCRTLSDRQIEDMIERDSQLAAAAAVYKFDPAGIWAEHLKIARYEAELRELDV